MVSLGTCSCCLLCFGCCQGGCRGCRRFLNCSTVVILMSSQGGSACESFLTIGVGAFIGSVARVGASVTGKRAAIAETLFDSLAKWSKGKKNRTQVPNPTYLGTDFAMMGLLSCVDAFVNCEGRSLNKLLATFRIIANMWSQAGMDSFCHLH